MEPSGRMRRRRARHGDIQARERRWRLLGSKRSWARKAVGSKGCGPKRLWARRASDARTCYGPDGYEPEGSGLARGSACGSLRHRGHLRLAGPPCAMGPKALGPPAIHPVPGSPSCVCITHELSSAGNCKMPQEVHEVWGTGQQRRSADNVFEHHHSPTHRVAGSRPEASSVTGRKLCGPTNSGP